MLSLTSTLTIPHITKTSSNNCLLSGIWADIRYIQPDTQYSLFMWFMPSFQVEKYLVAMLIKRGGVYHTFTSNDYRKYFQHSPCMYVLYIGNLKIVNMAFAIMHQY